MISYDSKDIHVGLLPACFSACSTPETAGGNSIKNNCLDHGATGHLLGAGQCFADGLVRTQSCLMGRQRAQEPAL